MEQQSCFQQLYRPQLIDGYFHLNSGRAMMQYVVTAVQSVKGLMGSQESYQRTLLQNNLSVFFQGNGDRLEFKQDNGLDAQRLREESADLFPPVFGGANCRESQFISRSALEERLTEINNLLLTHGFKMKFSIS